MKFKENEIYNNIINYIKEGDLPNLKKKILEFIEYIDFTLKDINDFYSKDDNSKNIMYIPLESQNLEIFKFLAENGVPLPPLSEIIKYENTIKDSSYSFTEIALSKVPQKDITFSNLIEINNSKIAKEFGDKFGLTVEKALLSKEFSYIKYLGYGVGVVELIINPELISLFCLNKDNKHIQNILKDYIMVNNMLNVKDYKNDDLLKFAIENKLLNLDSETMVGLEKIYDLGVDIKTIIDIINSKSPQEIYLSFSAVAMFSPKLLKLFVENNLYAKTNLLEYAWKEYINNITTLNDAANNESSYQILLDSFESQFSNELNIIAQNNLFKVKCIYDIISDMSLKVHSQYLLKKLDLALISSNADPMIIQVLNLPDQLLKSYLKKLIEVYKDLSAWSPQSSAKLVNGPQDILEKFINLSDVSFFTLARIYGEVYSEEHQPNIDILVKKMLALTTQSEENELNKDDSDIKLVLFTLGNKNLANACLMKLCESQKVLPDTFLVNMLNKQEVDVEVTGNDNNTYNEDIL